jgi:hypothetical protein
MGLTQHMQPPEFLEGSVDARIRRLRRHLDVLTRLRELQRIEQKISVTLLWLAPDRKAGKTFRARLVDIEGQQCLGVADMGPHRKCAIRF